MNIKTNLLKSIFAAILLAAPWLVHAIPISSDLIITGSVKYDDTNSYVAGTTQGGSISSTIGGSSTSSSISGATLTGSNPLAGTLTDIGDGFGSSFHMSGTTNGDSGRLISDYLFDINNTSATDQYQVTFQIDLFNNMVDANGVDAFADSQLTVMDASLNERFFSDLTSDTFFGDIFNGVDTGTFGDLLSDSGIFSFDVFIDPLATFQLTGLNDLEGGIFADASDFSGELSSFISIANVVNLTPPVPAPEPGVLLLMAAGLLGFACRRKMICNAD